MREGKEADIITNHIEIKYTSVHHIYISYSSCSFYNNIKTIINRKHGVHAVILDIILIRMLKYYTSTTNTQ